MGKGRKSFYAVTGGAGPGPGGGAGIYRSAAEVEHATAGRPFGLKGYTSLADAEAHMSCYLNVDAWQYVDCGSVKGVPGGARPAPRAVPARGGPGRGPWVAAPRPLCEVPPLHGHDFAVFRQVVHIVLAHGHTREAIKAMLAVADLRHDAELLARTSLVATRYGGNTLLMRAVLRDDVERVDEILDACPTPAAQLALVEAPNKSDAHATPLCNARSGEMAWVLLDAGAGLLWDGAANDPFVAACERDVGVLEALLESLGSDEERQERAQLLLSRACIAPECTGAHLQLLLYAGADPLMEGSLGRDAIEIVTCDVPFVDDPALDASGHLLHILLSTLTPKMRRKRVNRPNGDGVTLLMLTRGSGLAWGLLNAGANVRSVDSQQHGALWHAMSGESKPDRYLLGVLLEAMGINEGSIVWPDDFEESLDDISGDGGNGGGGSGGDGGGGGGGGDTEEEEEESFAFQCKRFVPPPFDQPDVLWQVICIVAAHGYTREAAKVMLALADLRHDAELLARTALVATRRTGDTLLMRAVKRDDVERAHEILDACPTPAARHALVEAPNKSDAHATPLCNARSGGMALELLVAGADLQRDGDLHDPFMAACVHDRDPGVLAALLESLGSDAARRERAQPLLVRASTCAHATLLLATGADPFAVDGDDGSNAVGRLVDVADESSASVLAALLSSMDPGTARERVNRVGADGRTLLVRAASASTARALLAAGADVRAVGGDGRDALAAAVGDDNFDLAAILLGSLGSDAARDRINHPDDDGVTLLMRARHHKIVLLLLDGGADVWAVDSQRKGVLDYHLQSGAVLGFLLEGMGIGEEDVSWHHPWE